MGFCPKQFAFEMVRMVHQRFSRGSRGGEGQQSMECSSVNRSAEPRNAS